MDMELQLANIGIKVANTAVSMAPYGLLQFAQSDCGDARGCFKYFTILNPTTGFGRVLKHQKNLGSKTQQGASGNRVDDSAIH